MEREITKSKQPNYLLAAVISGLVLTLVILLAMVTSVGNSGTKAQTANAGIMDKFDMYMTNEISDALGGVLAIDKVYWLSDEDLVAPKANPACFGETDDPSSLGWLLEDARKLLGDQELLFSTDLEFMEGSTVRYYLDETIFAITWKQVITSTVYTYAEVKIADASQFRRFLAGGEYGSEKQFTTTEMSESVNAVLASSGDFYRFRNYGTIVYNGEVKRINSYRVDTCMIDDKGDLHLIYGGKLTTQEEAQKYVDENNIRFSLAFGPILVDNGERLFLGDYPLGEVKDPFPRAALCQMDELHYLVVTANPEGPYKNCPAIYEFGINVAKTGCEKAYTLDGGQTAVIAMDHELVNNVYYGYQREISDIFYFATAVPDGG